MEKEDNYWLFTTNFLSPFKGFFSTVEEAAVILEKILRKSPKYYKKILQKEAELEIFRNEKNKDDPNYRMQFKAKKKLEAFKGLTEDDIRSSIVFLEVSTMKERFKKRILTEGVDP
jgi:hypothetical protein